MISGWNLRYLEIQKEFGYDKKQDLESAMLLNSMLTESNSLDRIQELINSKTVKFYLLRMKKRWQQVLNII